MFSHHPRKISFNFSGFFGWRKKGFALMGGTSSEMYQLTVSADKYQPKNSRQKARKSLYCLCFDIQLACQRLMDDIEAAN